MIQVLIRLLLILGTNAKVASTSVTKGSTGGKCILNWTKKICNHYLVSKINAYNLSKGYL